MTENIIGHNIRILRTEKKMTQEQLAQKMFVKRQTLSNYETGRRVPDIYELMVIADVFDVSLDKITGRKPNCEECNRYLNCLCRGDSVNYNRE
jgi:transcriptional regulator with XRE-family HTH domain